MIIINQADVSLSAEQLSDKELIDIILREKKTGMFSVLYDRYADKVFRKCISMVKNPEDARDLAHDILVKAFLNVASFAGNSSFSTWVYAITYNRCIDFLRNKQKQKQDLVEDITKIHDQEEDDEITEKQVLEMEIDRLKTLIFQLSEEDRAILLMKYQDEMQISDIETVLQITTSAVKMRLKRARDRLKLLYCKTYGNPQR